MYSELESLHDNESRSDTLKKKCALQFNFEIIHLQITTEDIFCWFTAMVSWGIRLREISCWSTVPKIVVPSISEIFELAPTNWNGPGFVSWVSVWRVVYSDTEILAQSKRTVWASVQFLIRWCRSRCIWSTCCVPDSVPSTHYMQCDLATLCGKFSAYLQMKKLGCEKVSQGHTASEGSSQHSLRCSTLLSGLRILHLISHLILTRSPWSWYHHVSLTQEETEAQRG